MAKKNQNEETITHEGEMVTNAIRWLIYQGHQENLVTLAETMGVSKTSVTNNSDKTKVKVAPGFLYKLESKALKPHGASLEDFIGAGNAKGPEDATRIIVTTNQRIIEFVEEILGVVTDLKKENKELKEEVAKLSRLIMKKSAS